MKIYRYFSDGKHEHRFEDNGDYIGFFTDDTFINKSDFMGDNKLGDIVSKENPITYEKLITDVLGFKKV